MLTDTPKDQTTEGMKAKKIRRSDDSDKDYVPDEDGPVPSSDTANAENFPKRHARKGEVFNRKRAYVPRDRAARKKTYPSVSITMKENLRFSDLVMELAKDSELHPKTGFMSSVDIVGEFQGVTNGPSVIIKMKDDFLRWLSGSTEDKQSQSEEPSGSPRVSAGLSSNGYFSPVSDLRAEDSAAHTKSQHSLSSSATPARAPKSDEEKDLEEKQKRLASDLAYGHDFAKGRSPLRCAYCQKRFLNKPTWSGHLKSCAASICKVCDKSFSGHPKRHREHADHITKVTALKAEIQRAL